MPLALEIQYVPLREFFIFDPFKLIHLAMLSWFLVEGDMIKIK